MVSCCRLLGRSIVVSGTMGVLCPVASACDHNGTKSAGFHHLAASSEVCLSWPQTPACTLKVKRCLRGRKVRLPQQ